MAQAISIIFGMAWSLSTSMMEPVTPWMFQGWNLAYNVAVECDQPRDKYFYITRGTQLLAEGERRHQGSGYAGFHAVDLLWASSPRS